ncbi:MAG: tRNA uridine-5-carboxymethylaminomethyl(34) synthesis GTPase MnmE [Candidatus Sumerlaeota bacterium]|nr:tRNA uridine-5-carboxymethylaminomethyl(34) synthesis GTPase MnmE [Candidatus Sumerlaeota bacterium]
MPPFSDTIVARATAPGVGAIAIVRCSGPLSRLALERCFRPQSASGAAADAVERMTSHQMVFGRWLDPRTGLAIDTVLAVRMDAPHSYTGEDMVEVHCHGGSAIVEAILDAFVAVGARQAGPGEFTRRAFLNGKLDLAQAEAVADLVQAGTARARKVALRQLEGALSRRIAEARSRAIAVIAELEAHLDFPEEDLPAGDEARLLEELESLRGGLARLAEQGRRGRLWREGARVVIAGPPNAGKSSLFNALAGRERALVSPHPGTTRDTIEVMLDLNGLAVTLVDTAGLRAAGAEEIERMGIDRTKAEIRGADVTLWLEDMSQDAGSLHVREIDEASDKVWLRVGTKADLLKDMGEGKDRKPASPIQAGMTAAFTQAGKPVPLFDCLVSSLTGEGMDALEAAIQRRLLEASETAGAEEDVLVSNRRHVESLTAAAAAIECAWAGMRQGVSHEFPVVDLRAALDALNQILGLETGEAILDAIFSRFCIGK